MARKTYNDEFKLAAPKLVRDQGDTIKKAAKPGTRATPG